MNLSSNPGSVNICEDLAGQSPHPYPERQWHPPSWVIGKTDQNGVCIALSIGPGTQGVLMLFLYACIVP